MNFVQSSVIFARQSSGDDAAMKLRSLHAWALATSLQAGGGWLSPLLMVWATVAMALSLPWR